MRRLTARQSYTRLADKIISKYLDISSNNMATQEMMLLKHHELTQQRGFMYRGTRYLMEDAGIFSKIGPLHESLRTQMALIVQDDSDTESTTKHIHFYLIKALEIAKSSEDLEHMLPPELSKDLKFARPDANNSEVSTNAKRHTELHSSALDQINERLFINSLFKEDF